MKLAQLGSPVVLEREVNLVQLDLLVLKGKPVLVENLELPEHLVNVASLDKLEHQVCYSTCIHCIIVFIEKSYLN